MNTKDIIEDMGPEIAMLVCQLTLDRWLPLQSLCESLNVCLTPKGVIDWEEVKARREVKPLPKNLVDDRGMQALELILEGYSKQEVAAKGICGYSSESVLGYRINRVLRSLISYTGEQGTPYNGEGYINIPILRRDKEIWMNIISFAKKLRAQRVE